MIRIIRTNFGTVSFDSENLEDEIVKATNIAHVLLQMVANMYAEKRKEKEFDNGIIAKAFQNGKTI